MAPSMTHLRKKIHSSSC